MDNAKVALVTGATRGIGRACVEALVGAGRRVIACARDAEALDALCRAHPGRIEALPIDLSEHGAAEWVVDEALRRVRGVTELVYAAGIVRYAAIGHVREPDLRAQLEVNFIAPFLLCQRLGMHMKKHGGGAMVLLASTLGLRPAPDTAAYAASKAALLNLTQTLARELAPEVRVNAVAPGVVDTDMVRVSRRDVLLDPENQARVVDEQLEHLRELHLLGRLGLPEDIARGVLYLLDASWTTGTTLTIDGGLSVR